LAAGAATAPKHWAPIDLAALTCLYAGKTWLSKNGAAYFAPDGRFKAWSRSNQELSEGFGTWDVRPDGVMCFDAAWRTISSKPQPVSVPKVETCFSHQARGRAIAQMKLPEGAWYFFRRPKPRKTDEAFKLRPGDRTRFEG
jgi:hypothetical protein